MKVELVFAQDLGGGIGFEGRLPWPHNKPDMARFQELTTGDDKIIVFGRKTHADILAAAKERKRSNKDIKKKGVLKGRTSIVLSSTETEFHGATGMKSLRDVFNEYQFTDKTIVVIGGEKLFVEAMAWANTVHVTIFDKHYMCDRYLPSDLFKNTQWADPAVPTELIPGTQWIGIALSHHEVEGEDCNAYFVRFTRVIPVRCYDGPTVRDNGFRQFNF